MSVDAMTYRRVVGNFATGVAVVTSGSGEDVHGVTVNSFTSVSLDPTLLLVCLDRSSRSRAMILETGVFNINVLNNDQERVSRLFASKDRPMTWFEDLRCSYGELGAPLIPECLAYMECQLSETHEAGDHTILIAEVQHAAIADERAPLCFFRGKYAFLAG
ncbi:MAG TPA: flavin reductase family protein [Dehalococcoidia bacterium]|nr:flavin reductase family protein [Dehalococcoidia bacterium]